MSEINLDSLPNEILIHICSFLEARFVLEVVSQICPRLQDLVSDDSLWKLRTKKRFSQQFPPVDPTIKLKWDNICAQQEEFFPSEEKVVKTQVKGHYASVDALLLIRPDAGCKRQLLVSGSRDRSVGLWDPEAMLNAPEGSKEKGLIKKYEDVHKGWVWSLSSNKDGKLVSCGWDNMLYHWSFRESAMGVDFDVDCRGALLCSSYVDNVVSVGTYDRKIKTYDLRSNTKSKPCEQYSHHRMPVLDLLIPENHPELLISASEDRCLATIDRRNRKLVSKLRFAEGVFPMCVAVMDGDNCLYVGDKAGGLHLFDCTDGKLRKIRSEKNLHSGKVVGIDASHAGIVTCSTDKTVKLLTPDLGMKAFKTFDEGGKEFGEVTAISHQDGVLAMGHSQEVIQVYSSREIKQ